MHMKTYPAPGLQGRSVVPVPLARPVIKRRRLPVPRHCPLPPASLTPDVRSGYGNSLVQVPPQICRLFSRTCCAE